MCSCGFPHNIIEGSQNEREHCLMRSRLWKEHKRMVQKAIQLRYQNSKCYTNYVSFPRDRKKNSGQTPNPNYNLKLQSQ